MRQSDTLSANLYKIYINNLLSQIENSGIGAKICYFDYAAPICADDVAILCDSPQDLHIIINMVYNYSCAERYKLQPTKSVIFPIYPDRKKKREESFVWTIGDSKMPVVGKATHVGILCQMTRTPSMKIYKCKMSNVLTFTSWISQKEWIGYSIPNPNFEYICDACSLIWSRIINTSRK